MNKRKMLFTERLMYVDGRTPVNGIITMRLRGSLQLETMEHALEKVQAKHPALRATVEDAVPRPCFVMPDHPPRIPIRCVERTDEDVWRKTTFEEWLSPFEATVKPLIRLVWIRGTELSELMLVAHHCICDGASIVTILREILQCMDDPNMELQEYAPFDSVADLLPMEIYSDKRLRRRARGKAALFHLFAKCIPPKWKRPHGNPYFISWQATVAESSALIARCKEHETTPYAAMCVSILRAFREVGQARFKDKLICPVNIRKFVPSLRQDMIFNYAPTIALHLGEDRGKPFWQAAKEFKMQITQKVDALSPAEEMIGSEFLHNAVNKLISLLFRSKGSYDLAFSNVGRVDMPNKFRSFQPEELLGVTIAVPWRNSTTLISTHYGGRINLDFVANDGFLPYSEACAIRQYALSTLRREL